MSSAAAPGKPPFQPPRELQPIPGLLSLLVPGLGVRVEPVPAQRAHAGVDAVHLPPVRQRRQHQGPALVEVAQQRRRQPGHGTAAGVPARLVNCPTCDEPARTMDHTLADVVYDYVI